MENAARNARAANPRARNGREVGAGATSTTRGVLPEDVDKISCTYPIDFNPWTLKTKFSVPTLLFTKDQSLLVPLQVPLDIVFLAHWNTTQGEFHSGGIR